jgi:hypothetical protein
MKTKTKELLDNLNKITQKPKSNIWEIKTIPDTNKMWKSTIDSGINSLPKSYDKNKWIKDPTDEDEDLFKWIDRMYGGVHKSDQKLVQKDGSTYTGKIHKKRRLIKGMNGDNFYSECRITADGRWFDNCGMPIEAPTKVEEEEEKETAGFIDSEPTEEELVEQAKLKAEREQKMLQELK